METQFLYDVIKLVYHEVHEDHEGFHNLISLCVLRTLRGDILSRCGGSGFPRGKKAGSLSSSRMVIHRKYCSKVAKNLSLYFLLGLFFP